MEQLEEYYGELYSNYPGVYPPGYEESAPDEDSQQQEGSREQQETDEDSSEQTSPFSGYWGQQTPPWFGGYADNHDD